MASIALRNIGSIDYLAYGSIFPKKKGDVFFPARKAADERCWGAGGVLSIVVSPAISPRQKFDKGLRKAK
jgi:hypothetical protein